MTSTTTTSTSKQTEDTMRGRAGVITNTVWTLIPTLLCITRGGRLGVENGLKSALLFRVAMVALFLNEFAIGKCSMLPRWISSIRVCRACLLARCPLFVKFFGPDRVVHSLWNLSAQLAVGIAHCHEGHVVVSGMLETG